MEHGEEDVSGSQFVRYEITDENGHKKVIVKEKNVAPDDGKDKKIERRNSPLLVGFGAGEVILSVLLFIVGKEEVFGFLTGVSGRFV